MRRTLGHVLAAITLAATATWPGPAAAEEIYPLVFPVAGDHYYSDTWGAARDAGRTHEGTDIMVYGVKGIPVVAAAGGTIGWMHDEQGGRCCALELIHDDGWRSWYIHLNNDSQNPDGTFTDDGLGWGFADGIVPGATVSAGQVIGYVGDSGNAESVAPHLHFELHRPDRVKVNPYPHLMAADPAVQPAPAAPDPGAGTEFNPPFSDDDGSAHEADILVIFERGITEGCAETLFCPSDEVTREQMAAFLARTLGLEPLGTDNPFHDVVDSPFEDQIMVIWEAGITLGCETDSYCPGDPVTRAQMASFLDRAFDLPETTVAGRFTDVTGVHAEAVDRLAAAGITQGCSADAFCPDDPVTREQMASFLARALRHLEA